MYPQRQAITRARELRKQLTPPEARLWVALRGRALDGLRFRRQHPIGPFIVDFFCPSARLVVEVDGEGHFRGDSERRDDRRDGWLEEHGMTVLRIPAAYVRDDLDLALKAIRAASRGRWTGW